MSNLICKLRIEGTEDQISEVCERLKKGMIIVDRSRFYPNAGSDKGRCYLVINLAAHEIPDC